MPSDILYGRVAHFRADVPRLAAYYDEVISKVPATQYHDNNASYEGWAITSRDGTTTDGVRRIERGGADATATAAPAAPPAPSGKGTVPTLLHAGALAETLDSLAALGLRHFRARVMRLSNEGFEMKWHRDADKESWRLHVPVITNPHSVFEWKLDDGTIHRIHMPADGGAWLIRVDKLHRAINNGPPGATRVHLLMSLGEAPKPQTIEGPFRIPA
jgi:hypothetical protein